MEFVELLRQMFGRRSSVLEMFREDFLGSSYIPWIGSTALPLDRMISWTTML